MALQRRHRRHDAEMGTLFVLVPFEHAEVAPCGRLVVIGGDAAGMSAASRARRGDDDLEIVALRRQRQ